MRILATLVFLLGNSAWACPDLTGTFYIGDEQFKTMLTITQGTVADTTIFGVSFHESGTDIPPSSYDYTWVSDNEMHIKETKEENFIWVSKETHACRGDELLQVASERGWVIIDGKKHVEGYRSVTSYKLNTSGNLQVESWYINLDGTKSEGTDTWTRVK